MFSPGNEVYTGKSSNASGDSLGGRIGPLRSLKSNGQSLSVSDQFKKLSFFLSGSRQQTDRRIDQPTVTLFNDRGTDYFLYGKFDYQLNKTDYITANLNYSKTITQVPFDYSLQGYSPDNQTTTNSFQTLSYFHTISEKNNHESNLFIGFFARQGTLLYQPSDVSPVNFQFSGDSTLYAITTNRNYQTYGIRTKYDKRLSKVFALNAGLNFSTTYGNENFTSRDSIGHNGPSVSANYAGSDFGVFVQGDWHPIPLFKLDAGVRYDQHIAPDVSLQKQFSPRIKLNFFTDDYSSLYIFYGKLFMPTNIEGLKGLVSNAGSNGIGTLPERSDLYELSYSRTFNFGVNAKLDVFHKISSPGVDDQTIGASAIKTPVNIETVKTTGIVLALNYHHPKIPASCYLNASLIHAYGSGAVTGGFLNISNYGNATDLDHDQRLSITAGINYQPSNWFLDLSSIYGSGLTNGNPNNITFGTGLFDFNKDAHVPSYITFNLSGGYTFSFKNGMTLSPSVYITNLFDKAYLLKGAYFSAASYGERRNVTFKLAYHL